MQASMTGSSVSAARQRGRDWLARLRLQAVRRPGDFLFRGLTYLLVLLVVAVVAGVAWVLLSGALPTIRAYNRSAHPCCQVLGQSPRRPSRPWCRA